MKTFLKTVLMIIVIILTTWTANADDALMVYTVLDDKTEKCEVKDLSVDEMLYGCITYLGKDNMDNTYIDNDRLYYNNWFDTYKDESKNRWVAHTTFFSKIFIFK